LKQRKGYAYRLNKILDLIRMTLLDVTSPTARREVIELASWHDLLFNETEAEHALLALKVINKDVETFDFTDMIYQAIQNPKVRIPKFDVVFVDEAQDLNKAQQALLFKMLKKKGRFIAVGDGRQAIYGFAGSDVESFSYLTTQENTVRLPLNVCYRCGSKIVEWAQRIVPELLPNPGGHRGVVRRGSVREIVQGDWVLCRNTKPLVSLCLALIREHRKATIKGRDYGNELIHLLQKCNTKSMRAAEIKLDLELYRLEKRLIKWGILHPTQAPSYLSLVEKVEILKELVFAEAYTIEAGIKLIQQIFSDDISAITLSTIHKSKGFENDRIFVLHPDLLPSKYATQEWQLDQERNLEYVMITRAKNELIYIMDVDK
jgi:DNA helicase-2/ATP-dependent DNA helicase PcrA